MADSSGLAGITRVATATFPRILGLFGNDLGADAARLGCHSPTLPSLQAGEGRVGGVA